ncbi:inorganic phosphate transporter PitA [Candidatus Fukatsuia anoeciicola]|uniref:inorganic phosphate transporter PitA n=1 Tax=Candidatus Fukatsuia anoeciicola TaxID=2994492 RepID=UPI0034645EBF
MLHLFTGLDFHTSLMLVLALFFVLFYEAINGFHDTANAVVTVIYTRAARSQVAVIMAGIFNFLGVMLGGLSVAYAIVHLLPTNLLLNMGSAHGLAMVFSMLLAAIIWNLGTWYFGIPASSSHTLIGSIIGVGLTNTLITNVSIIDAINIPKMIQIFLSLILSPLGGLVIASLILFLLRYYWSGTKKYQLIHLTPTKRIQKDGKHKPPFWIRIALIISAIGISFSHGANDGQKGIGLIMLVLIGIAPMGFILDMNATSHDITYTRNAITNLQQYYKQHSVELTPVIEPKISTTLPTKNIVNTMTQFNCDSVSVILALDFATALLNNLQNYNQLNIDQRGHMRRLLLCAAETAVITAKLPETSAKNRRFLYNMRKDLLKTVEYAPTWIVVAVALALSLGTMIGWKRVAVTIGEKIGKNGMTYAQGVSAQMTAAVSIGIASYTGMPVSTTQVFSSAIAGAMLVGGSGLQNKTVKNITLAWILTLPISIVLSGLLYWIALMFL